MEASRVQDSPRTGETILARPAPARIPWAEYGIEALGLGLFMISACSFGVVLFHPASPVVQAIPGVFLRRFLMGVAMGSTAITLIYSPWGRRSGAHFNPATTLAFFRLGRVRSRDVLGYVAAQFAGGAAGVLVASILWGRALANPDVHYVVTRPGPWGAVPALFAEILITFVLFSIVVRAANHPKWMSFAGLVAGSLVATYITFEAPISGMSMNPARSFASALGAGDWTSLWIYFVAPLIGMGLAAEIFARRRAPDRPYCAKLMHDPAYPCIFCETARGRDASGAPAA